MDELYELAKQETGKITVYSTTASAHTAVKKFVKAFPDLADRVEYIESETDTVADRIETERDSGNINADVLEGHYSSALCHLANASYRLGGPVPFEPKTKAFGDNQEAYETLGRMEEHLKENSLKLEGLTYQLGRTLKIDPATETVDDPKGNAILHGTYRTPFSVPDQVV